MESAMRQITFANQASFEKHSRKGKRELFLDQMEQVVPWSSLLSLIEPLYPKAGNGRQPIDLAIILRTYFLQQWFNLSDPGMEEAFYDSSALRRFAGVDLGVRIAPSINPEPAPPARPTLACCWASRGADQAIRRIPAPRTSFANVASDG